MLSEQKKGCGRILDNIRSITVFVKVVECGSFRAGAATLGLSPSVASHHISNLETQLGTPLLYRSTRKLAMTPAGRRLLESAQDLVASSERTLGDLASEADATIGPLRVTLPTPVAFGPLLPLIWEFAERNSGVGLSVHVADGIQDLIVDGFDIAIRMGAPEPGAMKTRSLCTAECVLVCGTEYARSQPSPLRPSDLASWRWVRHTARPRVMQFHHPEHGIDSVGGTDTVTTNAAIAILHLAIAGAGVATLPVAVARAAIDDGRLTVLLPDWQIPTPKIYAVWPPNSPRQGLTYRLVDFLSAQLAQSARSEALAVAAE